MPSLTSSPVDRPAPPGARRRAFAFLSAMVATAAAPIDARADATDACVAAAEAAQSLRHDAHLRASRAALVTCASESCPRLVRVDCKRWLGEVDAALPSVVVRASGDDGRELSDVRVVVDGETLRDRLDGRAIAVDPGEHTVRFERAGSPPVSQRLVVREGERDRLVDVTFAMPAASARDASPSSTRRVLPWIFAGAGTVATGAGIFLWARGRADRSDLYATCGTTETCSTSAVDSARTKILIGDIAVGAGILLIGTAAWMWLTASPSHPTPPLRVDARLDHSAAIITSALSF